MVRRAGPCYASLMAALILPLAEAAAHLPTRGALIGLDLGSKTIGVAASDPDRRLASAVETIARGNFSADAARLLALTACRSWPTPQHGRQRRAACTIDPRLCPQSRAADRS